VETPHLLRRGGKKGAVTGKMFFIFAEFVTASAAYGSF
jgi:hypothetical protein